MRSIWAIARNTLKQALRMKVALVSIVLLVILLPAMGIGSTGDGTLKGSLQTFVSYGLSLTSLLLCLLTIIVSVYTLSSDLSQKQIHTVLTKPVRRFELIVGKLVGVILLDAVLLLIFSSIIYTIIIYTPKYKKADPEQIRQVQNEFFTARASLLPKNEDVSKEVDEIYKKREKNGQISSEILSSEENKADYLEVLAQQVRRWKNAAVPGQELVWTFENVKPIDPRESLFIRYKYDVSVNPPDLQVTGQWLIGDNRDFGLKSERPARVIQKDLIRTFHEIEVPAAVVAKDGYLAVRFFNNPYLNDTVVIFPPVEGLEVLYKAGYFGANYLRAVMIIFMRLVFLACLGILASTFLSFPVAILLCLIVFCTGTISGFIIQSFGSLSESVSAIYNYTVRFLVLSLPQFDKYNPTTYLVQGKLVSWMMMAEIFGIMICIQCFILSLLAILIFSFKEVAKIIV